MSKKSALVTGAAGFIGQHVAQAFFRDHYQVSGMGHACVASGQKKIFSNLYESDIDIEALAKYAKTPDVIVHCAGASVVGQSFENPIADFEKSVQVTLNVLEYMRIHSPLTKLVHISSAAVYGHVVRMPIAENFQLNPVSPYGVHKQIAEQLCKMYAHNFSLSIVIVRPFSVYGNGLKKQLLWDACHKFQRGGRDFFGTGEEIRDWIHVDDVTSLLLAAEEKASNTCPVLNAGSGVGVPNRVILQHIATQFGSGIEPIFSSIQKIGDPTSYVADISQALALNWSPSIDWREGTSEYVRWFKSRHD